MRKYTPAPSRVPLCFVSQKQFVEYKEAAKLTRMKAENYCYDCTPEYKARMERQQRCAFSGTAFRMGDDGVIHGHRAQGKTMKFGKRNGRNGNPRHGEFDALFASGALIPA